MGQSSETSRESEKLRAAQDLFILEWGRLSAAWGINRTMAQIHALLLVTDRAFDVDEIIERLNISRGNASMNLRSLMDWGIVQRFRRPGDRKDTYVSESDPWQIFAKVLRERKRREIDPTATAIRECLAQVPQTDTSEEARLFRERMGALLEIFGLVDAVYQKAFRNDESVRETVEALRADLG